MGLCCSKNNLSTIDDGQNSAMLVAISRPHSQNQPSSEASQSSSELAQPVAADQQKLPAATVDHRPS